MSLEEAKEVSLHLAAHDVQVDFAHDRQVFLHWHEHPKSVPGCVDICVQKGIEEEIAKYSKRTVRVTREHNEECRKLLRLMGVPIVDVSDWWWFCAESCIVSSRTLLLTLEGPQNASDDKPDASNSEMSSTCACLSYWP